MRLDAIVTFGRFTVELITGCLVGTVEDRILLMKEDEVVLLDLDLRHFLGYTSVLFLETLPALVQRERIQVPKLARPYTEIV
jgi:hypothetical protein